jgi:hypothetical protein
LIISQKIYIYKNIGILSKLRYYVDTKILTNLYYALIYPFLIYDVIIWGCTYQILNHIISEMRAHFETKFIETDIVVIVKYST